MYLLSSHTRIGSVTRISYPDDVFLVRQSNNSLHVTIYSHTKVVQVLTCVLVVGIINYVIVAYRSEAVQSPIVHNSTYHGLGAWRGDIDTHPRLATVHTSCRSVYLTLQTTRWHPSCLLYRHAQDVAVQYWFLQHLSGCAIVTLSLIRFDVTISTIYPQNITVFLNNYIIFIGIIFITIYRLPFYANITAVRSIG